MAFGHVSSFYIVKFFAVPSVAGNRRIRKAYQAIAFGPYIEKIAAKVKSPRILKKIKRNFKKGIEIPSVC